MTEGRFDQAFWEERWAQAIAEHGDRIAARPPNQYVVDAAAELNPGRALDAGCGHGADTFWLATNGWSVTAVDFSQAALDLARATAASFGADVAARVQWRQGDLGVWTPEASHYDLVISMYVHIEGDIGEMVRRLAAGVAPGGTLLLVGHQGIAQQQVTVATAVEALALPAWKVVVAEERERPEGSAFDAVIRAQHA